MLKRRHLQWTVLLLLSVLAAVYIPTPYYILRPGPVVALGPIIQINGVPAAGKGIYLLSIAAGRSNLALALCAVVHPGMMLRHKNSLIPAGMDLETYLEYAQGQMKRSAAIAQFVALRAAGHEVQLHGGGLRVNEVRTASPWFDKLRVGDVISAVGSENIPFIETLHSRISEASELTVQRGNHSLTVEYTHDDLELGAHDLRRMLRGVVLENQPWILESPVEVDIAITEISGPSAALALSLEIYRRLVNLETPPGLSAAATGILTLDGTVGAVGGLPLKLEAAREAGVTVLFMPTANPIPKPGCIDITFIEVSVFREAVEQLHQLGVDDAPVPHSLKTSTIANIINH